MHKLLTLVSSHAIHFVNTIRHEYSKKGLYCKDCALIINFSFILVPFHFAFY